MKYNVKIFLNFQDKKKKGKNDLICSNKENFNNNSSIQPYIQERAHCYLLD